MKREIVLFLLLLPASYLLQAQPIACSVNYIATPSPDGTFIEFRGDAGTLNVISWSWDFGDGATSTAQNPRHMYNIPGFYIACVTILTADSCSNTYCDTLEVQYYPQQIPYYITGYVCTNGNINLSEGTVLLFQRNTDSTFTALKYQKIENGLYKFDSLSLGKYLLYAIPYFNLNVNYFPVYLPTYFGNSIHWQDASIINLTTNADDIDIHLLSDTSKIIGNGKISGHVLVSQNGSYEEGIFD